MGSGSTGPLNLTRVLVSNNTALPLTSEAGEGGGINTPFGFAHSTLTDVTITGNQAQEGFTGGSDGGGAMIFNATLVNVTIAGNSITASSHGGGGGLESDSSVTLSNTLVAGNVAGSTPAAQAPVCVPSVGLATKKFSRLKVTLVVFVERAEAVVPEEQ